MQIYGQLKKAGFESLAVDPSGTGLFEGRKWHNTTSNTVKFYDGAVIHEFADLDTAQIFVNKTMTAPVLNNPLIGGSLDLEELVATPANPAAGRKKLYPKDGLMYTLDENGNEVPVGSGGSGGGFKNYMDAKNSTFDFEDTDFAVYNDGAIDPVDLTGGVASGNLVVSLTSVVGEVLAGERSLKIAKAAFSTVGEGVSALTLPVDLIDRGKKLVFAFDKKIVGALATGDIKLYAYDVTNSVFLNIESDYGQDVLASGGRQEFYIALGLTTESVRIGFHVASTNALAYDLIMDQIKYEVKDVVLSQNSYFLGQETWVDNQANATTSVRLHRVGSLIKGFGEVSYTGAQSATALEITIPSKYTANDTIFSNMAGDWVPVGRANIFVGSRFDGPVVLTGVNSMVIQAITTSATYGSFQNIGPAIPGTFGNGNPINFYFEYEVADFANQDIQGLLKQSTLHFDYVYRSAPLSVATSLTEDMIYDTVVKGSNYNTTTGEWTCPRTARYDVTAQISASFSDQEILKVTLTDSLNAVLAREDETSARAADDVAGKVVFTLDAIQGKIYKIRRLQSSGASRTYNSFQQLTYVQFKELPFSQVAIVQQNKVALIWDEKASGVNGGASLVGANIRALNTIEDPANLISLSANAISFNSVGKYLISATATAFKPTRHVLQLRKNGTAILSGESSYSTAVDETVTRAPLNVFIDVTNTTDTYDFDHQISTAFALNGLGVQKGIGAAEKYTMVTITKIGG